MSSADVTYTPGDWVAVVGAGSWGLFDLRLQDERVQELWEVADAGIEEILDVLLRQGLRALPGFAVVGRDGDGLRYAIRQPARLSHAIGQTKSDIESSNADAWTSGRLEQFPDRLALQAPADETLRLPTSPGITSASALFVEFASTQHDLARQGVGIEDASSSVPTAETAETAEDSDSLDDASTSDHASTYYQLLVSSTVERDALLSQLGDEPGDEPADESVPTDGKTTAEPAAAASPSVPAVSEATSVWSDEISDSAPDTTPADSEPPTAAQNPSGGVIDGVPWASSLDVAPSQDEGPGAPTTYHPLPSFRPSAPPPAAGPDSPALTPPYPPEPVSDGTDEDTASVTISRAALLRQLAEEHGAGTTVLALRCGLGHLSPTYSENCRVCGTKLAEQTPIEAPRPPLGRLALSNGSTVLLDRGVIFGRAPHSDATDAAGRPNLVRLVDSGEISRMHASVMLDGWQVLLRDLGSQNGTILTLPGHDPEQIRPHEDYVLEVGSVISFADVVTAKFEVAE